jgi:transcriptional regulator with XRE-family HTH domain
MENKNTAYQIASRRKSLGLTQQALADKLHITNKAVSKWETGEGLPDISILADLAKALETTTDELLSGTGGEPQEINIEPKAIDRKKRIRLFRIIARAFLLAVFFLPFIMVPISKVLPDWLGLDSIFNNVFGNSLQAGVTGFQMMLTFSLTGVLLLLTFIVQLTLWILDLASQLDHRFFEKYALIVYAALILIAMGILGVCILTSLSIQIGLILFVVFTLSLCLFGIKSIQHTTD